MKVPFSRTLSRLFGESPLWTMQPTSLQVDTTNRRCQLNCIGCNPQNLFIRDYVDMPMSTIEDVFRRVGSCFRVGHVYPFMNTDPTLELRLPEVCALAKKTFERCYVMVSTNGVSYNRRQLLNDVNIDEVSFTVSAATPEMYFMVHRRPYFEAVNRTLKWLDEHRHRGLRVGVRYILFDVNVSELEAWKKLYCDFPQEIWAFHYGDSRKVSSQFIDANENSVVKYYRDLRVQHFVDGDYPCNCFHNLAVGVHGEVMQCCDLPYSRNWGHIDEVDLKEVWMKRLELGLNHEGCKSCSQKNPRWRELFEKYVW